MKAAKWRYTGRRGKFLRDYAKVAAATVKLDAALNEAAWAFRELTAMWESMELLDRLQAAAPYARHEDLDEGVLR